MLLEGVFKIKKNFAWVMIFLLLAKLFDLVIKKIIWFYPALSFTRNVSKYINAKLIKFHCLNQLMPSENQLKWVRFSSELVISPSKVFHNIQMDLFVCSKHFDQQFIRKQYKKACICYHGFTHNGWHSKYWLLACARLMIMRDAIIDYVNMHWLR